MTRSLKSWFSRRCRFQTVPGSSHLAARRASVTRSETGPERGQSTGEFEMRPRWGAELSRGSAQGEKKLETRFSGEPVHLTRSARGADQRPGAPLASFPRTRHHTVPEGSGVMVRLGEGTVRLAASGPAKLPVRSTSMV